jgi:hypothetical protein
MLDTRVTWLLTAVGSKTHLTSIHGGFARPADISNPQGLAGFLAKLRDLVLSQAVGQAL